MAPSDHIPYQLPAGGPTGQPPVRVGLLTAVQGIDGQTHAGDIDVIRWDLNDRRQIGDRSRTELTKT